LSKLAVHEAILLRTPPYFGCDMLVHKARRDPRCHLQLTWSKVSKRERRFACTDDAVFHIRGETVGHMRRSSKPTNDRTVPS
jgi:hypothetical protein